ncbi:MAG TPA: 4Fe-4S binding protein [Candidatus Fimadaptatus faecigallinarum]|uniref:Ferredoxin n=1 Tax=Candidatus Fimadaptatus faecigallinarum TaxID=2840814 RepID=A0A9D1LQL7_9FIRM|nr:4Fe-4S binding protein [Candidatus Fimadaptatus faecigallinarum]
MLIKRVTLIYFSPTGGTLGAARLIAGEFRAPVDEIDITDAREPWARAFGPDELVVVAAPCYGGRVPAPAAQRLPHFSGRGTPAVAVVAFGNRAYDDALRELGDILTGNGFIPVAGAAIVTEHSLARQYGAGRPDESDRAELRAFAMKVRVKLGGLERAEQGRAELGDEAPYRQFGGLPVHPTAGRECTSCGICARVCPAGAINPVNPARADGTLCITCMRCVQMCPRGARSLPRPAHMAIAFKLRGVCASRKPNALFM